MHTVNLNVSVIRLKRLGAHHRHIRRIYLEAKDTARYQLQRRAEIAYYCLGRRILREEGKVYRQLRGE